MRALIFHAPGQIGVENVPDPVPSAGEVLLRVAAAGVCASDLRVFRGEKYAAPGVIPGHEFAGTVVAVGPEVDNVAVDDRVAVYPVIACGGCEFCARGLRNRCLRRQTLGYDQNGGLAEYTVLPAASVRQGHLALLPPDLPMDRAAMTEPVACVLNSLESCRLRAGGTVAVLGAGPMGLKHVVLARALGAGAIVVAEPAAERRRVAEAVGATSVTDGDVAATEAAVRDASGGRGADVVIVSVGLEGLTETALRLAARQGVINLFAGFPPGSSATLDVNRLHGDEISLLGTQNATPDQFRRTAALLPSLAALDGLITHRFEIAQADQAYDARRDPSALKTLVLPDGPAHASTRDHV